MHYGNTPTLETPRLILRRFTVDDSVKMHDLSSNSDVMRFIPRFPSQNLEETRAYICNSILALYEENKSYYYALELKNHAEMIGYLTLNDLEGARDLGYALRRQFWYQGYIAEAAAYFIKYLDNMRFFPFITATHDVLNPNSGRVMQKLGMQYQYSYEEIVQPKNYLVTFRLYQYNFSKDMESYQGYAQRYGSYIERFV